jgi:hypothetical protein
MKIIWPRSGFHTTGECRKEIKTANVATNIVPIKAGRAGAARTVTKYLWRRCCCTIRERLLGKPNTGLEDSSTIIRYAIGVFRNHGKLDIAVIAARRDQQSPSMGPTSSWCLGLVAAEVMPRGKANWALELHIWLRFKK